MLDDDPAPALEDTESYGDNEDKDGDDNKEPEVTKPIEMPEAQRGESKNFKLLYGLIFPIRMTVQRLGVPFFFTQLHLL